MNLVEQFTFGADHTDRSGHLCCIADIAIAINRQRVEQLIALKAIEKRSVREWCRAAANDSRRLDFPFPHAPDGGLGNVHG